MPHSTPLRAVLALAFVNSLGTGIVTNGVFFLANTQYGLSLTQNYALGLLLGALYIPGALLIGPALRALAARYSSISTRAVLAAIVLALAVPCFLPTLFPPDPANPSANSWVIWLVVAIYAPLTGVVWPITESYLSGGRRGQSLRSAVGKFNVVWAGALVIALVAMGPLLKQAPATILPALGAMHLVGLALLPAFAREPARHLDENHEPHPPVYTRLLEIFRIQLPTSYIVLSALNPFLPSALERLEIDLGWHTPLVAVWMLSRVGVFGILQRWDAWHGRWWTTYAGGAAMLGGFGACVLSPLAGPGAGLALLLIGLGVFGAGMGMIYAAALYYAMEVGHAQVEAGGMHEALIGLGYAAGPMCGLAVAGTVGVADARFEPAVLGLVAAIAAIAAAFAVWRARRHTSNS